MKEVCMLVIGTVGSMLAAAFGGWSTGLAALLVAMGLDYITGLIVAGVFHKSPKTENGALESKAGWKGLCRKIITLLLVALAHRLDLVLGTTLLRDGVVIGYLCNELISITENLGRMGVYLPPILVKAIDSLKES